MVHSLYHRNSLLNNYCPIFCSCVFYQRFWKEYNLQLNNELCNELNSFTPHKFGFLPKRSALQQLIFFAERLLDGKNNTNEVDVIYMDFKKAFDSVPHNALLSKLRHFW